MNAKMSRSAHSAESRIHVATRTLLINESVVRTSDVGTTDVLDAERDGDSGTPTAIVKRDDTTDAGAPGRRTASVAPSVGQSTARMSAPAQMPRLGQPFPTATRSRLSAPNQSRAPSAAV